MIHKDPRIDLLVKKQAQINEETSRNARRVAKGFRLLVDQYQQTGRGDSCQNKNLYLYFPELKSYLLYQSPYFKLKVGNFKERKEAEDYQKKLNDYFPKGVFIMNDMIEIKPDKEIDEMNHKTQKAIDQINRNNPKDFNIFESVIVYRIPTIDLILEIRYFCPMICLKRK